MEKDKLVLANGITYNLEDAASLENLRALFVDASAAAAAFDAMTDANLAEVTIKNGAGLTIGRYSGLKLSFMSLHRASDGVVANLALEEKSDTEKRLDALEEGQEVQDGAIEDLGAATSALAEGGSWNG